MLSCFLNCQEKEDIKYLRIVKTKHGRIMALSNCLVRNSKKSKFIKGQETKEFSRSTLGKISILSPLLV